MRREQCLNVSNFFNKEKYHDVTFIVGGEEIEFTANRTSLALILEI